MYSIIVNNISPKLKNIDFGGATNIAILNKTENNLFISVGNENILKILD